MQSPVPAYLQDVLDESGDNSGELADYIPELASADPNRPGAAICTVDGVVYTAGDTDVEVSIQSVSKPFAYALAIADKGLDAVLEKINVEPSGDAFNEISLDPETGRPSNPMINAGAIAAHSLIDGKDAMERSERFREFASELAGRELTVDDEVYESEMSTAFRNMALAYLLRSRDIITGDPEDAVRGYIRQCSVRVTAADLALMAGALAAGGIQPTTGKRLIEPLTNRQVLSVMGTCGMYDAAGDWITSVGIPAKSGVSGVLIGALPGQVGVSAFSPKLDEHGNSVRGVRVFERMSEDMGMHMLQVPAQGQDFVRTREVKDDSERVEMQGRLEFPQAEVLIRNLVTTPPEASAVVLDLSRVSSSNDVGSLMLRMTVDALREDGLDATVHDPDGVLQDPS